MKQHYLNLFSQIRYQLDIICPYRSVFLWSKKIYYALNMFKLFYNQDMYNWKNISRKMLKIYKIVATSARTGFCQHQNYYQQYTKCGMICVISPTPPCSSSSLSESSSWSMQRELCTWLTSPLNATLQVWMDLTIQPQQLQQQQHLVWLLRCFQSQAYQLL